MPDKVVKSLGAKCTPCVRIFKLVPVLFIAATIGWSYYAYMVQLCYYAVENVFEKIFYYIVSHIIFVMFIWSYWKTIVTPIGVVPPQFKLSLAEAEQLMLESDEESQRRILENFARDLPVHCRTMNGSIRYCEKCRHIKPDRAHHCSICGVCVLKMDHHCPWVNNCVSFTNYKFFILFLGYALLYCFFVAATTLKYFIQFWTKNLEVDGKLHILFLFFVALMFGISLISLFAYHCYLVAVNKSTLESFRSPVFRMGGDKNGFNIGRHANFIQVFGEDPKKWFLPVHSSIGNGVEYPTRMQGGNYNSMGNTDQESFGSSVFIIDLSNVSKSEHSGTSIFRIDLSSVMPCNPYGHP